MSKVLGAKTQETSWSSPNPYLAPFLCAASATAFLVCARFVFSGITTGWDRSAFLLLNDFLPGSIFSTIISYSIKDSNFTSLALMQLVSTPDLLSPVAKDSAIFSVFPYLESKITIARRRNCGLATSVKFLLELPLQYYESRPWHLKWKYDHQC